METIVVSVVLAVVGLAALLIVVRAGYGFRAEFRGAKVEVTPPSAPRPPP